MKKITIFDAEIEAGIGEQIRSQASIAYVSPLCISDNENDNKSGTIKMSTRPILF